MKFSVPKGAMIVVADGAHAIFYRNTSASSIKIEKTGELAPRVDDGRGPAPVPHETSAREYTEANFAKHLATHLYDQVHQGGIEALVLIADPQTLGQIRPSLHREVTERITGELHKTLVKSSLTDIEHTLTTAIAA